MLKLVTGDEQNWVWKGKRRHFGTMLPRRWEIRKMEEVAQAEIFLQFIFHSPRFWEVHWFYSRGEKTFYAKGSLMDILLMGTSIITAPIILWGAITVSTQWNQNKPEIWKIHLPRGKTISAAEVLLLMVYGRVYSQWHRSLNHSSGLIVPQISRYRQSGWLEVLLGEHCEKAGGRNRALRRFRRLIPTAIEASRPCKCKYGGEVIFLI